MKKKDRIADLLRDARVRIRQLEADVTALKARLAKHVAERDFSYNLPITTNAVQEPIVITRFWDGSDAASDSA